MNKEIYPAFRPRPYILVLLVFLHGITAFSIWFCWEVGLTWLTLLFMGLGLGGPLMAIYMFTSKVALNPDSVRVRSALGNRQIMFNEIKDHGIYNQKWGVAQIAHEDEIDDADLASVYFIYLSKQSQFNPNAFKRPDTLLFHYRADLFKKIQSRIAESQQTKQ